MITSNPTPWQPDAWQNQMRSAFRNPGDLLEHLGLKHLTPAGLAGFPMLAPRSFVERIVHGDPQDALLLQVLPQLQETEEHAGFVRDPLGETNSDQAFIKSPGLIQKYQGRALMITTPACAINCRYCFRRHFPYQQHRPRDRDLALAFLRQDASISEIILSGGDPLLMQDSELALLLASLAQIEHIKRIRIHTRLPIVVPQRITFELMQTLAESPAKVVVVIHSNHHQELNAETRNALDCLGQSGATLLNQSVLLRGINDNVNDLVLLSERLFEQGVLPYYLHLPDKVANTAHFYVDTDRGQALYGGMKSRLPGYLLPRLVREVAGDIAKREMSTEDLALVADPPANLPQALALTPAPAPHPDR